MDSTDAERGDQVVVPQKGTGSDPRAYEKPKAAPVPRTQEYVTAGSKFARLIRGLFALAGQLDDAEREYGVNVYEAMMNDPAVGSSVDVLRQGAIRDIRITPPPHLRVEPGKPATPEQEKAQEIADFCQRAIHAPQRPLVETLYEFTYGLVQDKLAEIILRNVEAGPDAGRLTFDRFKFKQRESWKYVVDAFGNVPFIAGTLPPGDLPPAGYDSTISVPGTGGNSILLERDRFAIFAWAPRDSDPRTRPIARRAYNAWNLKVRTWPEKLKNDIQFGTPNLLGIVSENAMDPEPEDVAGLTNADGTPVTTSEDQLAYAVSQLQNGTAIAVSYGTDVKVIESSRDGSTLNDSIELYNKEIATAILHAPRATQEAQHGSKADAEQASNVTAGLMDLVAGMLAGLIRYQWLRMLVRVNFGPGPAEYMLPEVMNGEIAASDLPGLLTGMAAWVNTGQHTKSQLPSIDAALALPVRDPNEPTLKEQDQAFEAEQSQKAMDAQAQQAQKKQDQQKPEPQKTRPR